MREHSERIVIWGMSCVGKTTFAQQIDRPYLCFDALFPWHEIETFGLSVSAAMTYVGMVMASHEQFVLDGWHLSDQEGGEFPSNTTSYVLYAPYERIVGQYRAPVDDPEQHRVMFEKWYSIKHPSPTRYFVNDGSFVETSEDEFRLFQECNL